LFKVNDTIMYGTEGVCQIIDIEEKDFLGEKREYYVIKPQATSSSTIYVPTDSEVLVARMRHLLSAEELNSLIDSLALEAGEWIENERERKERYKSIAASPEASELFEMMGVIYREKKRRESEGRRLHMTDERFLAEAEQCVFGEIRCVLGIKQEEVASYISDRVENKV
jgi:CarD family transcriptional regulator